MAFREVHRQAPRKSDPRDLPFFSVMVENGFSEAAAVIVSCTDKKDPPVGARDCRGFGM